MSKVTKFFNKHRKTRIAVACMVVPLCYVAQVVDILRGEVVQAFQWSRIRLQDMNSEYRATVKLILRK